MAWTPKFYWASSLEQAESSLESGNMHYPGIVYINSEDTEHEGYIAWVNIDNTLDFVKGYKQVVDDDGYVHSISIGTVTTGQPGASAQVTNVGTDKDMILNFVIPRGYQGEKGDPGEDGKDGKDGADGKDGEDGFSPVVAVEKEDGVTTITITDLNGEHIATIEDGKDGVDGVDGKDGADGSMLYGTCYTASFTSAKLINCAEATSLYAGLSILMKFTIANTAASPTLNVNSLGARPIYVNGAAASESNPIGWASGTTILYSYDGDYWIPQAYTQNYYGICNSSSTLSSLSATSAGYVLAVGTKVSIKFTNDVNGEDPTLEVSKTGAYPVYFQGKPVEAGALKADNTYEMVFNGSEYELQSVVGVTGESDSKGEKGDPGEDGKDGKDGVSPTIEVSKEDKVTTLTITDVEGVKTATINDGEDGKDGENGKDGEQGEPGEDGVSPTVSVSKADGVTTVVFTDVDGEHTATINDGVGTADIVIATDEEIEEMLDRVFGDK